jgi:hypothetical protein
MFYLCLTYLPGYILIWMHRIQAMQQNFRLFPILFVVEELWISCKVQIFWIDYFAFKQRHVYFRNLTAGSGGFDPKALGAPEIIVIQYRCSAPGSRPSDIATAVHKWQECVRTAQSKCTVSHYQMISHWPYLGALRVRVRVSVRACVHACVFVFIYTDAREFCSTS